MIEWRISEMKVLSITLLATIALLPGCGLFESEVPPDVIAASEGQAQIIEMQGANTKALILAYDADLRAAYDAHSRERLNAMLATGQYDTPAEVTTLLDQYESNRARYHGELNAKRDEFLGVCANNIETGKTLNDATRRYLDFLSESRARLQEVLNTIKGAPPPVAIPPEPVSPQPTTQPSNITRSL